MENQVLRVVQSLAEDLGTPRALAVKLLCEAGEWTELQKLKCRPRDYIDSESYWRDTIITDLLRKCDLPSSVDREAGAVQTFLQCEKQNCATNARLNRYLPGGSLEPGEVAVADFISQWRKDIKQVLGNLPDHLTPRFSHGATFADTGLLTTIPDKMSSAPTIYEQTRDLLPLWHETSWSRNLVRERPWFSDPLTVRGNIFFTVPKDGTKFRGCCKEASVPVTYQLDVGRIMKLRMKRIGIDLKSGQDLHRRLAKEASVGDDRATIDMSNASDTLCHVLVRLLLPEAWWTLLDSLRAKMTRVNGRWYRLEKFSSMGNGFTFELETLIFATLARLLTRLEGGDPDEVTCYGDDLIVGSGYYRSVIAALRWFGFEPNLEKTFGEGPFRESCGGDYWRGIPVRGHFVKELPDEPQQWISLANGLRRSAEAGEAHSTARWAVLRRSWFRVLDCIPSQIRRCRGPVHLGDIVIHDDETTWSFTRPRDMRRDAYYLEGLYLPVDEGYHPSWEERYIKAYMPIPIVLSWDNWYPGVQQACCTLGTRSEGVTPRGGVSGYRIGSVGSKLTSKWVPEI
jgi:hypothetical protein